MPMGETGTCRLFRRIRQPARGQQNHSVSEQQTGPDVSLSPESIGAARAVTAAAMMAMWFLNCY